MSTVMVAPLSDDEEQVPRSDRPRSGEALIELADGETSGKTAAAVGRVIRTATDGDLKQIENNRQKAMDAVNTGR